MRMNRFCHFSSSPETLNRLYNCVRPPHTVPVPHYAMHCKQQTKWKQIPLLLPKSIVPGQNSNKIILSDLFFFLELHSAIECHFQNFLSIYWMTFAFIVQSQQRKKENISEIWVWIYGFDKHKRKKLVELYLFADFDCEAQYRRWQLNLMSMKFQYFLGAHCCAISVAQNIWI